MKVMFIVYHDLMTDARSQEIWECASKLSSDIVLVSYSKPPQMLHGKVIITGKGRRKYFSFIRQAIMAIKTERPEVVILHDNYTAAILRWLYKRRKNIYVIYDSSELYINRAKPTSLKLLIARHMGYFEKKYLKYADIVIAANLERAAIMKEYFLLKETPIIFDNIHKIDDHYDKVGCDNKYGHLFDKNVFTIIYGGGIAKSRMTFELAEAVGKLGDQYRLIITGQSTEADRLALQDLLEKKGWNNIEYLGFLPRNEWRYLLQNADISVSAFAQDTVNNINCASGKLYEGLFEGTPVLVTENPPLKRICNEFGVGVSNNDFQKGILELKNDYESYQRNVHSYIKTIDMRARIEALAETIKEKLIMQGIMTEESTREA